MDKTPLLEVKNFSLSFPQYLHGLEETWVEVISNFELTVDVGEILAIVGASGSGKSLLADAILGILPKNAEIGGSISYDGKPLSIQKQKALRGREIMLIPQSVKALDPLMKVGKQVQNLIDYKSDKKEIQETTFLKLGLSKSDGNRYPFELSGGMARRVLIAAALVSDAKLIVADEPTPGLDKKAKEETLNYIRQLAKEQGKAVLFITHDIKAALEIADNIAVFNKGKTLEIAKVQDFVGKGEKLKHPYSRALWNALPENDFYVDSPHLELID